MRERHVLAQPGFVILGPFCNIDPSIRATQHGTQGHENHLAQIVPLRRSRARIRQNRKCLIQRHRHPQQKLRVNLNSVKFTSQRHNPLTVNGFLSEFTTIACAIALVDKGREFMKTMGIC